MRSLLGFVITLLTLGACGSDRNAASDPSVLAGGVSADVAELEIRGGGVDRFVTCPPPGSLGQHWIPKPFPWTAPSAKDVGTPHGEADELIAQVPGRSLTEVVVDATHRDFRSCYRKTLIHDPSQDGHVAIVLRVAQDGRVEKVESYAGCELASEAIACMVKRATRLRFPPSPTGADILTIPVTFTSRDGVRRTQATSNDAYTAGAYLTVESARPQFHACEEEARKNFRMVEATGTFTLNLAPSGQVTDVHIDPWTGDKTLLACAARQLQGLVFASPPAGKGVVTARLNFNPRQGTR